MKAAQIKEYGGEKVVVVNEAPKPAIAAGKVVVKINVAGVNPIDWKVREGYLSKFVPLTLPATSGGDFSGVVVEVGEGVNEFKVSDAVYGNAINLGVGTGAFAEFALTPVGAIAKKPGNMTDEDAAALPLAGVSALTVITEHMKLGKGQKILIHGGAGGIGTFAIQIAKEIGAEIATTASASEFEYVKALGATTVIDYKNERFEDKVGEYDAVFDTVGGETYERSFKVLKKGGVIVSMLEKPKEELATMHGVKALMQSTEITRARLEKLSALVEKGALKIKIDKVFSSIEQASAALEYLKVGHPKGKVVVKIGK